MKITIDLPEWAEERHIYVMAGIELLAHKLPDKPLYIKTERCNMCGKCCMDLSNRHPFPVVNGRCIYLQKEPGKNEMWRCELAINRPFGCSVGIPRADYCPIRFEEIK